MVHLSIVVLNDLEAISSVALSVKDHLGMVLAYILEVF